MANEGIIKVDFPVLNLATLTAKILKPDLSVRDGQNAVTLDDDIQDYVYSNPEAITIESGDMIQPLLSGASIGASVEYKPSVTVDNISEVQNGIAIESKQDTIIEDTDELVTDDVPALIDALPTATENSLNLLETSGFTIGGTLTISNLFKIIAAWIAGTLRLKSEETNIYETLDADDDLTVIMETTLITKPDPDTDPYKEVDIL